MRNRRIGKKRTLKNQKRKKNELGYTVVAHGYITAISFIICVVFYILFITITCDKETVKKTDVD